MFEGGGILVFEILFFTVMCLYDTCVDICGCLFHTGVCSGHVFFEVCILGCIHIQECKRLIKNDKGNMKC